MDADATAGTRFIAYARVMKAEKPYTTRNDESFI